MEISKAALIFDEKTLDEIDEMRTALAAVADEIESFEMYESEVVVTSNVFEKTKTEILEVNYKSKLKSNRQIIAKLRKDLKAACWLAKTLESTKKREITALTSQLVYARGECVDLLKRYNNNIEMIANLHNQNANLHERLENLDKFIYLGYNEIMKEQNETTDEQTTLDQLKKLIENCGRYYADYCKEIEISSKIRQKNQFLKNKIIILESNIQANREQLIALEFRYKRLLLENNQIKAGSLKSECLKTEKRIKENKRSIDDECFRNAGDSVQDQNNFDLFTHLSTVNRLLSDQDALLKHLNSISEEISTA